jgi:LysR family transcriptional regulator, transcriptional activator of nhaA
MSSLNYKHLYYFWVVAKEGGFARASERLDVALQTISTQVRELEKSLGHQLLKPLGRTVTLTQEGEVAFRMADEIFQIGQKIPQALKAAGATKTLRLAVGLSDGISKLAAHSVLGPILQTPHLQLICHEGEFQQLTAELALHQLDIVLAGQTAPHNPNLRLSSQMLSSSNIRWYAPLHMAHKYERDHFPQSLDRIPVLLPTPHAAIRLTIDRWFDLQGLSPKIVGEFEDSALLSLFAAKGLGAFPVSEVGSDDIEMMRGLKLLGTTDLKEEIHAIYTRRSRNHLLVQTLLKSS